MGKGLVEISSPQGMAAESASAAVDPDLQPARLRAVDHPRRHRLDHRLRAGPQGRDGPLARRRTHGPGLADHPAAGRPRRCRNVVARSPDRRHPPGRSPSSAIMCAAALYMRWHSRRDPIGHHNVNDEWDGNPTRPRRRFPSPEGCTDGPAPCRARRRLAGPARRHRARCRACRRCSPSASVPSHGEPAARPRCTRPALCSSRTCWGRVVAYALFSLVIALGAARHRLHRRARTRDDHDLQRRPSGLHAEVSS